MDVAVGGRGIIKCNSIKSFSCKCFDLFFISSSKVHHQTDYEDDDDDDGRAFSINLRLAMFFVFEFFIEMHLSCDLLIIFCLRLFLR